MNAAAMPLPATHWLTHAPHRHLFAVGGGNLLLSMAAWATWLLWARFAPASLPASPMYAGHVHAVILPFLVFGPFLFGFLFTVFPRWMKVPDYGRWHYLPVGGSLLLAQVLLLGGLFGSALAHHMGLLLGLAGWTAGLVLLLDRLRHDDSGNWHARSAALAIGFGWLGMLLLLAHRLGAPFAALDASTKLGVFGLLLPIYLSVAHRMFPFFAQCVVPGYVMWRPLWLLAALWPLLLGHALLQGIGALKWLWLVDLPLTALGLLMLYRWWPRAAAPPILRALFIGLAWLPIGFALFSLQSLLLWVDVSVLGRAPLHALTVGLFGAVLVAMVSRVTKGHSGRPLAFSTIDRAAFAGIQAVAVLRVLIELSPDALLWNGIAALAWVLVLLPWVGHNFTIWSRARIDGKPG